MLISGLIVRIYTISEIFLPIHLFFYGIIEVPYKYRFTYKKSIFYLIIREKMSKFLSYVKKLYDGFFELGSVQTIRRCLLNCQRQVIAIRSFGSPLILRAFVRVWVKSHELSKRFLLFLAWDFFGLRIHALEKISGL